MGETLIDLDYKHRRNNWATPNKELMKKIFNTVLSVLLLLTAIQNANAQLNQMGAAYFQNQFQTNPAMAGLEKGLNLNMGYLQQWSNVPGNPTVQTITADYSITEKAALGLNFYNDRSGIFSRTRTVASYAYHLPLNSEEQKLSFGLSLGFMSERVNTEDIRGNVNDPNVAAFNQRETYMDGDFGLAYTNRKLNVQAAIPNMKSFLNKDVNGNTVDRSTFFSAISYKFDLEGEGGFGLEPKLAYRGVKGLDNIMDAGLNLTYANNKINVFGMYHSTKSSTFGVGLNYQNLGFGGMYSTANSILSNYSNGNFELSLKMILFKKNIAQSDAD